MKITVQANTNPIDAGALAVKPLSFASGGGGGGSGGPVDFVVRGGVRLGGGNNSDVDVPASGTLDILNFTQNYTGAKQGWGVFSIQNISTPNHPWGGGVNASLEGLLTITIDWAAGEQSTMMIRADRLGSKFQQRYFTTTPLVNYPVRVTVVNGLYWHKTDLPVVDSPVLASFNVMDMTILEF
jgi:hypothetical protein